MTVPELDYSQLGVAGLLLVIVLREVLGFLRSFKPKGDFQETQDKINELHSWLSKEDADGVKLWYFRRSLETVIKNLATSIDKQSNAINKLVDRIDHLERQQLTKSGRPRNLD